MNNTLLGRCTVALSEAHELTGPFDDWTEICTAAVLQHLAAELVMMNQREPRLTIHELARRLEDEAASIWPEPIGSHPSLTAEQRNPSLK